MSESGRTNHIIDQKCLMNNVLNGLPRPRWENFIENFGLHMRHTPNVQLSELIEELMAVEFSRKALYGGHDEVAMVIAALAHYSSPIQQHGAPFFSTRPSSCSTGPQPTCRPGGHQPNHSCAKPFNNIVCGYCGNAGHGECDCYDPASHKIVISRDIVFNESENGDFKAPNAPFLDHGFFADLFSSLTSEDLGSSPTILPTSDHVAPDLPLA